MDIDKITHAARAQIAKLELSVFEERRKRYDAEERFDRLLEFAPEAIVLLDAETGKFLDASRSAQELFGVSREGLQNLGPFDLSPPIQPDGTSRDLGRQKIAEAIDGSAPVFEWWHFNSRGEKFPCEVRLVKMPWGHRNVIRGTIIDITYRKRLEVWERKRGQLLEQLALGLSFDESLARLVEIPEALFPGMLCSILLVEGSRLRLGAAPSLPDFYNMAVDGLTIGPDVGSCGAAAATGQRIIAKDVAQHENWNPFRELAQRAEIGACWSEPIKSLAGEVIGTFAMYYREPHQPEAAELDAIELAAQLAATLIEHDRSKRALDRAQRLLESANRQLQDRVDQRTKDLQESNRELAAANEKLCLASVAFESYDSIIITDEAGKILQVNDSFSRLTGYTAQEAVGKTPRILKSGMHDEAFYRNMWAAILQDGYWEGEIWNKRKNGIIFPQRLSIRAVANSVGEITHFVGDGQDVTEHKRAAAARSAIEIAGRIQQGLFPEEMPCLPGFDVAGAVDSAERVSGDYFDFIPASGSRLFAAVADVCGHGLGPALMTAQLYAFIRALTETYADPGVVLTRANQLFYSGDPANFATVFIFRLDAKSRTLNYAGAGHRGYVLNGTGGVTNLESTGLPLGIVADGAVTSAEQIQLDPGDIVLLATDGVEETRGRDESMFGTARLIDLVRMHQGDPASTIIQAIFRETRDFADGAPQDDDRTMVIAKVL